MGLVGADQRRELRGMKRQPSRWKKFLRISIGVWLSRLRGGGGEINDTDQLFCFWRSHLKIRTLPACVLRWVNKSPSPILQELFKLLFLCCISVELFVMLSL